MSVSGDCDTRKRRNLWSILKVIYEKTMNIDAVRRLLEHSSVTTTSSYIGVTDNFHWILRGLIAVSYTHLTLPTILLV